MTETPLDPNQHEYKGYTIKVMTNICAKRRDRKRWTWRIYYPDGRALEPSVLFETADAALRSAKSQVDFWTRETQS